MSRSTRMLLALGALALVAAVAVRMVGSRAPARPPNVLFVVWDTVRADHLSLYGYEKPTTPRLDAFAEEAAVYERATAPGMWTLNSHAAMFTGLYERTHGATPGWRWLDAHHLTLAEILSAHGYDTFGFSANIVMGPMTNLTQGFATFHTSYAVGGRKAGRYEQASRQATRAKLVPEDASTELSPAFTGDASELWDKARNKEAGPVAHQALIDFLAERPEPERPFFAFLNLMEAHTPRLPSMAARRRVADEATIAHSLRLDQSLRAEKQYMVGKREYSAEDLAAFRATYDAALVDLDDATGDLLDDLRSRGLLDDTLVIVVSDHGESLGEHRMFEHRWTVHEPLLHVPLVVRYPPAFAAGRVAERVSTVDLFATVLELAGVPRPEGTFSTSLVGRRLFDPFVFSQMLDPWASELADLREMYEGIDLSPWLRTYCVAYQGDWKLWTPSGGPPRLFDLARDPGELEDRAESEPERRDFLLAALRSWEGNLPAYDPAKRAPTDGARRQTDEEQALLELLGYVGGDEQVLSHLCGR